MTQLQSDRARPIGWFAPATMFPASVSVVIRGIDWAYWEVFARAPGLVSALHGHVRAVPGLKAEFIRSAR